MKVSLIKASQQGRNFSDFVICKIGLGLNEMPQSPLGLGKHRSL